MRVIAGRLRGRKLLAPRGLSTRPTLDRVREAVFQILGDLDGTRVVDAYAGTGALGIEALSRGASHAVFVEANRRAAKALRDNLQRLGLLDDSTVVERPLERAAALLARLGPFDLVLADPPWAEAQSAARAVALAVRGHLAPGCRVLIGHPADRPVELGPGSGLSLTERRRWGGSGMSFYRSTDEPRAGEPR